MNNQEYAIEILKNVRNRANTMKVPNEYGTKFIEGVNTGLDFISAYIDYCINLEEIEDRKNNERG